MKLHLLHISILISQPLDEVFPFFADAYNLQQITPPWLNFHVVTPKPIEMRVDQRIDYKLRIRGIPVRWKSAITAWEPPYRFVDEQLSGPYRVWIHEHRVSEVDGGTLVEDMVDYAVPGGAIVNKLLVERDVRKIFEYRGQRMRESFGSEPTPNDFVQVAE